MNNLLLEYFKVCLPIYKDNRSVRALSYHKSAYLSIIEQVSLNGVIFYENYIFIKLICSITWRTFLRNAATIQIFIYVPWGHGSTNLIFTLKFEHNGWIRVIITTEFRNLWFMKLMRELALSLPTCKEKDPMQLSCTNYKQLYDVWH